MRRTGFLILAAVPLLFGFAPAAEPDPAVTVTAPAAGSVHRAGGSLFVTWHNDTGRAVDMWLVHGGADRVAQLAAKLSAAPAGETATVLPDVPEGAGYTIEIIARDGGERGSSPSFTVGRPAAQGPPTQRAPGLDSR
ncbi:GPI anchored serine-threonine rich family protein [Streptomyces sp. NPDC102467]|uniref:GPI anchored serine-threonine rich family protein n=1 Tax=Streptomyces sp. NPDC102467 TaxID=3366179 RepID=UPI0037F661DE